MEFREKLAFLAKLNHYSQRELASLLGDISIGTVNRWFLGKAMPDMQEGLKIAKLFRVPFDFLADDTLDEFYVIELYSKRIARNGQTLAARRVVTRLKIPSSSSISASGFVGESSEVENFKNNATYFMTSSRNEKLSNYNVFYSYHQDDQIDG